jgi:hypothetical protein
LFATGVIYTSDKFAAIVVDTSGKLPPALLTPVANFAAGIVDTGGKIATGIINASEKWWKNLPPVPLIPVANLPPVSLILVVHLDL